MFFTIFFLISLSALRYSIYYIKYSSYYHRFVIVKVLFVISIAVLIFSKRFFLIFLGWDGLGVSSFALILFYLNIKRIHGGMITILTNRMGDAGILLVIAVSILWVGSISFKVFHFSPLLIRIILIVILTKRAQYPFSTWLPLAIAAPTPISALVHSSTLVAAGIYLFIDNLSFWSFSTILILIFVLAGLTLPLSVVYTIAETDIKKIVALSTLNQLRIIFLVCRLGGAFLSFAHLISHAIFKSLLFFNVGIYLHCYFGEQDYRLNSTHPRLSCTLLTFTIVLSLINLIGLFYLSGFYSKDFLLTSLSSEMLINLSSLILFISLSFTIVYSFRLFCITTINQSQSSQLSLIYKDSRYHFRIFTTGGVRVFIGWWIVSRFGQFTLPFSSLIILILSFVLAIIILKFYYPLFPVHLSYLFTTNISINKIFHRRGGLTLALASFYKLISESGVSLKSLTNMSITPLKLYSMDIANSTSLFLFILLFISCTIIFFLSLSYWR